MEPGQLWYPRHPTLMRLVVALTTSLIVISGALYVVLGGAQGRERGLDVNFFGVVVAALLPSVVFVLGVKQPRSVAIYGPLLIGITAFAWPMTRSPSRRPWPRTSAETPTTSDTSGWT